MKITQLLRKYWHDIYYSLNPKARVHFALRCKDAAEKIDLGTNKKTPLDSVRLQLHLSLCQACKNYDESSSYLKKMIRKFIQREDKNLDQLNQDLLKKFTSRSL